MGAAREATRRVVKDYMLGFELPHLYKKACQASVNAGEVLFINVKQSVVPDAFDVIMPYLRDRYGFDVKFEGLNQAGTGFGEYHERCRELMEKVATAECIILEDASDVISCLPLRPETKVAQLWHACGAFKKWGRSTAAKKFGPSSGQIDRHPFYGNLSLVTVSSPEVEWAYREAMDLENTPDVVKALGVSRTDVFFDEEFLAAAKNQFKQKYPQIGDRKIILYAPTFRGAVKQAKSPEAMDIRAMKEALGDGYALAIKHHPFVRNPQPIPEGCEDFAFTVSGEFKADVCLSCADVLVTDYSSVVFEYSLLDRPMVFFAPDYDDYCDWRGFYYDYEEMTPGPVVTTTGDLLESISRIPEWFDADEIGLFRNKFMSSCDGHATEHICHELFGPATR